ncbi:unnamed protein product [Umbelopsis ramanniana]
MTYVKNDENSEDESLSRRNALLLNNFTEKGNSQDPITELPPAVSSERLICYWDRVDEHGHLRDKHLFKPSDRQREAWRKETEAASKLASPTDPDCDEVVIHAFRDRLDRAVSSLALQPSNTLCAILIYDCQRVVLAQVSAVTEDNRGADIGAMIVDIRDQWLLESKKGPVVELLENWQNGSEICEDEDLRAQIRWFENEERLHLPRVSFELSDLHRIVFEGIAEAHPADDIPRLDLGRLVDNRDATARGQSFLTDLRIASYLDPLKDWLFSRVGKTQALFQTFWSQTSAGAWVVCADAMQQYEDAVQQFLRALMVPIFIGSGQQGRRSEFMALRWRNTTWSTRDLFLHDGQMIFVLSYHQTRSQSDATRWPIRYVLLEVAQLATQYLVLVQPFRSFLHCKAPGSGAVSDHLWSRGHDPWEGDAVTRIVIDAGERIWGSLSMTRFGDKFDAYRTKDVREHRGELLIEEGGDGDQTYEALDRIYFRRHMQADCTRNRVYGGTVNFRGGSGSGGDAVKSSTTPPKRRRAEEQESPCKTEIMAQPTPEYRPNCL